MLTRDQALEILRALQSLPGEKVTEVADFITYLRERYGRQRAVDESDAWSDEDLNDVVAASLAHAERSSPGDR